MVQNETQNKRHRSQKPTVSHLKLLSFHALVMRQNLPLREAGLDGAHLYVCPPLQTLILAPYRYQNQGLDR